MTKTEKRWILTVLVPDRVGVLRDVTRAVAGFQGNIDAFRQSIVAGLYSLVLTVTFETPPELGALDRALRESLAIGPDEPALLIMPYGGSEASRPVGSRYVAMIRGRDRPGLLFHIASFLSRRSVNIEDWQVEFDGDEVIHIGQVTVPDAADIRRLQEDFRASLEELGLSASLCHENIFRATHEIYGLERGTPREEAHD